MKDPLFSIDVTLKLDSALTALVIQHIAAGSEITQLRSEVKHMRDDLKQFFADTKTFNDAVSAGLDNIQGDINTLGTKIAALEAAQNASGETTDDEKAAMADLKSTQAAMLSRVQAIAAETPEAPTVPEVPPVA